MGKVLYPFLSIFISTQAAVDIEEAHILYHSQCKSLLVLCCSTVNIIVPAQSVSVCKFPHLQVPNNVTTLLRLRVIIFADRALIAAFCRAHACANLFIASLFHHYQHLSATKRGMLYVEFRRCFSTFHARA